MPFRSAVLVLTIFFPALVYGQAVVDCARWRIALDELALSEKQLFDHFHRGTARAEQCEIDSKVTCSELSLETFSAENWSSQGSAANILFPSGDTAKTAHQTEKGWEVASIRTASGVYVDALSIDATGCRWNGLRWKSVEISKWNERAKGIRAHKMPMQTWSLGHFGLLPPALRASASAQEASVMAQVMSFDEHHPKAASLIANFSPGNWLGVGVGLTTSDASGKLLWSTVEANFGADDILTATGDFALHGDDAHRLGAHLELGSDAIWGLRKLEYDAFLQTTPSTMIGASLRGPGHELTIRTSMLDPSEVDTLSIRYGTQFESPHWITDVHVAHHVDMDERQHSSDLALRVGYALLPGAVQLMPHLDVLTNFGVIPTESGFEASTSATLMPGFRASVPIVGTHDSWTHRLTPQLHILGEVYGFTQRGILPSDVPRFLFTRRPGLVIGHLGLDQVFETTTARVSLPVGVNMDVDRDSNRLSPHVSGHVEWKQWRLRTQVLCDDVCDQVNHRSTLGFWTSSTFAEAGASRGVSFWTHQQMGGSMSPLELWRVTAPIEMSESETYGHLRMHTRMGAFGVGTLIVTDLFNVGATAGLSWNFDDLGWGWSARAGIDMHGEWSSYLGFALPTH